MRELIDGLNKLNIKIYGLQNLDHKIPIVSINIPGIEPKNIANLLKNEGIITRPGIQCAPLIHRTLNTEPLGTLRISLGYSTTQEDIRSLLFNLKNIKMYAQKSNFTKNSGIFSKAT